MSKRHFLMLAQKLDIKKHSVAGQFMSEKLDGCRCFWDGGASRGVLASQVPWANTEKDGRLKTPPIATGLWSRYGKVIHAPEWFLNNLPSFLCDGELYAGPGRFQFLMSTVKKQEPDEADWQFVHYRVFDTPHPSAVFADGKINEPNFKKTFKQCYWWFVDKFKGPMFHSSCTFQDLYSIMQRTMQENQYVRLHPQEQLPFSTVPAVARIEARMAEIVNAGGEGVMIRRAASIWTPERSWDLMKYKPFLDAEGTVVGYQWGRETDKGSKLLGLMGAMEVEWEGKRFWLSGFTDEERTMTTTYQRNPPSTAITGEEYARVVGSKHPGETVDLDFQNQQFPRGSKVTFKYRELTDEGLPKEARYWRTAE